MSLRLDVVYERRLDANVMSEAKFDRLLQDVRNNDYNPITVSPMLVYYPKSVWEKLHPGVDASKAYVICDGKYRYRAAKKLGKSTIEHIIESVTEEEALPHFYKRQRIHGVIDPFKEAELFLFERVVNGRSRTDIAHLYGLSGENYIKTRMKFVNVADNVIKLYYDPPPEMPGKLTFTHLRELSVLPRRRQKEVALRSLERNWGTRELMEEIRRIKDEMGTRAPTAYIPAPKEIPAARPLERTRVVHPSRTLEKESDDRERDHERDPVLDRIHTHGVDLTYEDVAEIVEQVKDSGVDPTLQHGPLFLNMEIAEPILKRVLVLAYKEGLDLRGKTIEYNGVLGFIDGMLMEEMKLVTTKFFEGGMQSELLRIIMRALQLYYRADQMEEEEDE